MAAVLLGRGPADRSVRTSDTDGFSAAFVWAAAIAAAGGLITLLVMRGEKTATGSDADPVAQDERVGA
ncbi:hypothetical protein ACFW6E_43555 [Streptomyces olivaceoviridis]|uniref:hypothetical protein n=1 Tax=Streptomyces olivaceoviridis TaxID=1921 RepID=UPI0036C6EEC2